MIAPASTIGPVPPASLATELGPTARFAGVPGIDPNAQCHFDPRLLCTSNSDCPAATRCHPNKFCVRIAPIGCATNVDCPADMAPESCRTVLWVSDHVGVSSVIEFGALP
jgi:hypothetical protein